MKICKNCQNEFPNCIKINGSWKNLGARKFCLSCSPFGSRNTSPIIKAKPSSPDKKICFKCSKEKPFSEFHLCGGRAKSYCKECDSKRLHSLQKERKLKAITYKGGKCKSCGYNRYFGALDFHHRNPNEKDPTISKFTNFSFEKIKKELDKCDLLCSNCHREIHGNF